MGKLKTHSPTYYIMDNWENMPYLTHTQQNISDRYFISSMSSDKFAQWWWWWDGVMYKETNTIFKTKRIRLFSLIISCTIIMKTNSRFSRNVYAISNRIWCNKHLRHTTTEKNMITMGKVDTSDLMMIITWAIDISFQSPILKWASWTHTTPYIEMKIKGNRKD